jgi:NADH dehydrogenase
MVNKHLSSIDRPEVLILGDVAVVEEQTLPMLAQVAVRQAKVIAYNIEAQLLGRERRVFHYHSRGVLLSLGSWFAVGQIGGVTISGRFAWWLWRTVYLFNFLSTRKRLRIAAEWTINLFYPRDISKLS